MERTVRQCPCCDCEQSKPFHHDTLLCLDCGHAWYPRDRIQVQLKDLYNQNYFTEIDYSNYVSEGPVLKKTFARYLRQLTRDLPPRSTILEIGCAYGFFMDVAEPLYSVTGIDLARDAVEAARAKGHRALVGALAEQPFESSTFDAVCLWDTIEHLEEPRDCLRRCSNMLKAGGFLYLTTGDLSSMLATLQGEKWRMFHPPSHLQYFSRTSLTRMLQRAGFEDVESSPIAQWHSLANVLGGLRLHSKSRVIRGAAGALDRLTPHVLKRVNFPIPTGDILWVKARKGAATT
jgi:2-polyprenyl-3-methyl-5-hydroxy-6-metoxy-1,4-benzoquinol methylase